MGAAVAAANLHVRDDLVRAVEFPPFDLLHWFEDTSEGFLHLSHSEMQGLRFSEFGQPLPDLNLGEATPRGSLKLRSQIGALHQSWPDDVLVCNGASEANFLVQAALLSPGDGVIAETPLYPPLPDLARGLGAEVVRAPRIEAEGWRLDLDALEAAVTPRTRLVVLTNLNNPTSGILRDADMRRLADLAEAHGFHVHVDETFRELAFESAPPSATVFGPRFVVTSTVTKAYGLGGLRLGWVVAATEVIARVKAVKDYVSICPGRVSEELAGWALDRREALLRRAKEIVSENRRAVEAWMAENSEVSCVLPPHGNICFPRFALGVDELTDRLREVYKVVIAPGRFFGSEDHFRLGLGGSAPDLAKGLQRLGAAIGTLAWKRSKAT